MRFIGYIRARLRGCKIDWGAPVEINDELRRALHPRDPEALRAGRLRRPFFVKPVTPGGRSGPGFVRHPPTEPITHEANALVFAYPDDSWFLLEAPENDG